MTNCAAVDCKNRGNHVFPKEQTRRKLWEKALRRKHWKATISSRLCSIHFKPEDYYGINSTRDEPMHKFLRKTAVPSLFLTSRCEQTNPSAQERADRLLKRNQKKTNFETSSDEIITGPSDIKPQNETSVQRNQKNPYFIMYSDEKISGQSDIKTQNEIGVQRNQKKPCFKMSFNEQIPITSGTETQDETGVQRNQEKSCLKMSFAEQIPGTSGMPTQDESGIQIKEEIVHSDEEIPNNQSVELPERNKPDNLTISTESKTTQVNFEHVYGSIQRFKDNDNAIAFYTGFETYAKFHFVFSTLSPMTHLISYYGSQVQNIMSAEDQFFMTMMKLRQNKCNFELAEFFQISQTTVYNIFITWINYIDQLWSKLNIWPEKDLVINYMPNSFKKYYRNVRVIIGATEIKIQKPVSPLSQQSTWSSDKHSNTLKVLVGATPGGLLSYCSPAYAGSISDQQIVEKSDLLKKCKPGDTILADKEYNIQDKFIGKDINFYIPTFLKGKMPGLKFEGRKIAGYHVHIERLIGLAKTYKILEELNHNHVPLASKIFFVCIMCCNFRERPNR